MIATFHRGTQAGSVTFTPESDADRALLDAFLLACVRDDRTADRPPQIVSAERGQTIVTDGRQITMAISPRTNVIASVLQERAAQDRQWGGEEHDDEHTAPQWLQIIGRHLAKARGTSRKVVRADYRSRLVKVAALCVAAIEAIDRRHAKGKDQ